jgi:hypothetical protein
MIGDFQLVQTSISTQEARLMEVEGGGRLCSCFPTLPMWTRIDIAQADRAEPLQRWNSVSAPPSPRAPMIFEDRFPSGEFAFQSIWIYISAPADRQVGRAIFRYGTVHPGISNTAPNSRHVTKAPKAKKSGNYCSLLKSLCRTRPSKEEAPAITCTSIRPQSAKIEVSQYA